MLSRLVRFSCFGLLPGVLRCAALSGCVWVFGLLNAGETAALELRIAIQNSQPQVTVGSSTVADLVDGTGRSLGQLPALTGFFAQATPGAVALANQKAWRISIRPRRGGVVYVGQRWYRGTVTLFATQKGITAVNAVDIEDYLASVVGKEVYASWPSAVLKAQAVAARSFALYRLRRQKRDATQLYDLGSSTTYQVYSGLDGEAPSTRRAVKETHGQVLTYQGKLIEAVFHASSGGHTEHSENVWRHVTPYLRGVKDYDQESPNYRWSTVLPAAQLTAKVPDVGQVKSVSLLEKTFTGRVKSMKISGTQGSRVMTGRQFRKAFGLKSTLFEVEVQANGQFQVMGRGHGHGLGMSQWGAYGLAQQGQDYQTILKHYYRGSQVTTLPLGAVGVDR